MLQYTPELAVFDSRSLLMNVGASLSLFKGPHQLCLRIRRSLQRSGYQARIGMAPTALGALLLARQTQTRRRRVLRMQALKRQLNALHVDHLPAATPYLSWLHNIGCTTLLALARLPRSGLRQRTSMELLGELDAAYGTAEPSLEWYRAPDTFQASCQLDFHTIHTQDLMSAVTELVEQLCGWLQARQHLAASMQFSLHHEKGRHACPPTCFESGLSTPSRHVTDFLPVLDEQLRNLSLPAPVIAIALHGVQTQPEQDSTGQLFPNHMQQRQQENQLLDVLRARLGQHSILQPGARASHIPEQANHWAEADTFQKEPADISRAGYPFWMLNAPVPLSTDNERPRYQGHTLQLIRGPHRIESGWWEDGKIEQRDYFVACDEQHCLYWVFRQRGTDSPQWFLHGFFA